MENISFKWGKSLTILVLLSGFWHSDTLEVNGCYTWVDILAIRMILVLMTGAACAVNRNNKCKNNVSMHYYALFLLF